MYNQEVLTDSLTRVTKVLKEESCREKDKNNLAGGIVELKDDQYTVLVPDLHGRHEFLQRVLNVDIEGETVLRRVEQKTAQIVCVGDGMHGEARVIKRWKAAFQEYLGGFIQHDAMFEEMDENFKTMKLVMDMKINFPDQFHFLKGNHENIMDENGNGNHSFAKFAAEGPMTRRFIEKFYGETFLLLWNRFEKNLPLVACDGNFIVSHARPKKKYEKKQLINFRQYPDLIEGITWTRDQAAEEGCAIEMMKELIGTEKGLWFCGHTAISTLYKYWNKDRIIQFHNPKRDVLVVINPGTGFSLSNNIFDLSERMAYCR